VGLTAAGEEGGGISQQWCDNPFIEAGPATGGRGALSAGRHMTREGGAWRGDQVAGSVSNGLRPMGAGGRHVVTPQF
jgi:hypothetical protein